MAKDRNRSDDSIETRDGEIYFYNREVKRVESTAEEAKVGETVTYRVIEYILYKSRGEMQTVRWKIKIDDEIRELTEKTGEEIELTIENEWAGREILIMPYLIEVSEDASARTWCHILEHDLLRRDSELNKIAVGETVNLVEDSIRAVCNALNELTISTNINPLAVTGNTTIRNARIVSSIKLFQNEYMNEKTGDREYEENCSGEIDQKTICAMDEALLNSWKIKYYELDGYSNGVKMFLRVFGEGSQKAVFLIGGLHGDELGGKRAIRIMKDNIKNNPNIVPASTTVYVLNPASNSGVREINGLDPNRYFTTPLVLRELVAIIRFICDLLAKYPWLTIISAHSYNDPDHDDPETGRVSRNGIVFPLYNLTDAGRARARQNLKFPVGDRTLYSIPEESRELRELFNRHTGFKEMDMFDYKAIVGELIYFIDQNYSGRNISMIEFETPKSLHADRIQERWGDGFINFISEFMRSLQSNA